MFVFFFFPNFGCFKYAHKNSHRSLHADIFSFLLGKYIEFQNQMVSVYNFIKICQTVFQNDCFMYTSISLIILSVISWAYVPFGTSSFVSYLFKYFAYILTVQVEFFSFLLLNCMNSILILV